MVDFGTPTRAYTSMWYRDKTENITETVTKPASLFLFAVFIKHITNIPHFAADPLIVNLKAKRPSYPPSWLLTMVLTLACIPLASGMLR